MLLASPSAQFAGAPICSAHERLSPQPVSWHAGGILYRIVCTNYISRSKARRWEENSRELRLGTIAYIWGSGYDRGML